MSFPPDVTAEIVARAGGRCEVGGSQLRGERGRDWSINHRLPRGMGGTTTPDTADNGLAVCGDGTTGCHGWLEAHREFAYALGYLIHRTNPPTDPATVPVIPRGIPCTKEP